MMSGIRLTRLPDRTPVKMTLQMAPQLHADLSLYANLYTTTYGEEVPVADLICAILTEYLANDRVFVRARRS